MIFSSRNEGKGHKGPKKEMQFDASLHLKKGYFAFSIKGLRPISQCMHRFADSISPQMVQISTVNQHN